MFGRKLACSFCGKNEDDVAKLVAGPRVHGAGPRVYICDQCVAAARRLMERTLAQLPVRRQRPLCRTDGRASAIGRDAARGPAHVSGCRRLW